MDIQLQQQSGVTCARTFTDIRESWWTFTLVLQSEDMHSSYKPVLFNPTATDQNNGEMSLGASRRNYSGMSCDAVVLVLFVVLSSPTFDAFFLQSSGMSGFVIFTSLT